VDWACWLEAEAIFDDQPDVIKEARTWGLKGYPIKACGKDHEGPAFWSFADAVGQFVLDQAKKALKKAISRPRSPRSLEKGIWPSIP
jgi:hypothetical protein